MITSTGISLKGASLQDVFDFAVFSLIQQGKPALKDGNCVYRVADDNGVIQADACRCAAGHLIDNSEYVAALEGKTIDRLFDRAFMQDSVLPSLRGWINEGNNDESRLKFLRHLQSAHDQAVGGASESNGSSGTWLSIFRINARKLAADYGLDASITAYREPAAHRVSRGVMERWPNEFAGAPRPRPQYASFKEPATSRPPYLIIGADDEIPSHTNGL